MTVKKTTRLILEFLRLGIACFFSGFLFANELTITYLYYVHDTGITFTGMIAADIMLMLAGGIGLTLFSRQLFRLRRATQAAINMIKKEQSDDTKK